MPGDNKKPRKKAISPINQQELPVPGPGRPKGLKDSPTCRRQLRSRWVQDYRALCKALKADGYDSPLSFIYQEARRQQEQGDSELIKWLVQLVGNRRIPTALDPDQADLALRLAEVEAEEKGAADKVSGRGSVNIFMPAQAGEYYEAITKPVIDAEVEDRPALPEPEVKASDAASGRRKGEWEEYE